MPSYSLDYIAKHIEAELVGDSQYKISGLNTIEKADSAELTFLANPLYKQFLSCTCGLPLPCLCAGVSAF